MGRFYMFVVLVIAQLALASHASADVSPSFTIQNYLKVEDRILLYCNCVDVGGTVSTLTTTVGNCIDKEFQTVTCPNGGKVDTVFCSFRYYQRNRQVTPSAIAPLYTNVQVWTRTGPTKTYYQLATDAIYGTTEDVYFSKTNSIGVSSWYPVYEGNNIVLMKDKSVGSGRSFPGSFAGSFV